MTAPYTPAEFDIAAKLYAEFSGYDLANRLPLRCQGPWMQRQWCAVARLAVELVEAQSLAAVGVRVLEADDMTIPAPPLGACLRPVRRPANWT